MRLLVQAITLCDRKTIVWVEPIWDGSNGLTENLRMRCLLVEAGAKGLLAFLQAIIHLEVVFVGWRRLGDVSVTEARITSSSLCSFLFQITFKTFISIFRLLLDCGILLERWNCPSHVRDGLTVDVDTHLWYVVGRVGKGQRTSQLRATR